MTKTMESERAAEWVRCYYDAWNRRDWEWIGAMLDKGVEWFAGSRGETVTGVDAVLSLLRNTVEGYPDALVEVRSVHVTGSVIVCECSFGAGGVQSNAGAGIFCDVFEIRKGRCFHGRSYGDSLQLLMELGQSQRAA